MSSFVFINENNQLVNAAIQNDIRLATNISTNTENIVNFGNINNTINFKANFNSFLGNVNFNNNIFVIKNLDVSGNVNISEFLNVLGNVNFNNNLLVNKNLNVSGNANISELLHVLGNVNFNNNLLVNKNLNVSGNANISEVLNVLGNVNFNNNLAIIKNLNVSGNANISEVLHVLGNVNFNNNLAIIKNLNVQGTVHFNDNLTVNKNLNLNSNLNISGNIVPLLNNVISLGTPNDRFKDLYLSAGTLHIGTQKLSASADGNIIFDNVSIQKNLNVLENVYFNDNLTINKNLNVLGSVYFNDNLTINKNMNVLGSVYFNDNLIVNKNLNVLGSVIFNDNLTVNKNLNVLGSVDFNDNLTVHKNLNVLGSVILNDNLTVNKNMNVLGSVIFNDNLTVHKNLNVLGSVILNDNLTVNKNLNVLGSVDFNDNLIVNKNLNVLGSVIFNDNLTVNKNLNVLGSVDFNDNLTVHKNLNVLGNVHFNSNLTVYKNLNLNSNLNISGNIVPLLNNVISLGTPNDRFKDLYLSAGTLHIGTEKLSASADGNIIFDNVSIQKNLNVLENVYFNDNLTVNKNLNVLGSVIFNDNLTIYKNLNVLGNIDFNDNLTVYKNLNVLGSVYFNDNLTVYKNLNVLGSIVFNDNLIVNKNINVLGSVIFNDNLIIYKNLDVLGSVIFNNNLTVNKNLNVLGSVDLNDNLTVNKNLNVLGSVIFNDNLIVNKNMNVLGSVYFNHNLTVNKNLNVLGSVLFNDNLTVYKNLNLNNNLNIAGNIVPLFNNIISLGTPNDRFKDLYLSAGTLHIGTEKLSASADGNILFENVSINTNLNVDNTSKLGNTIVKSGNTFNVTDGISTLGGKLIVNNESNLDNTIIRSGKTFTVIDGDSTLGGKLIVNNQSTLKDTNITGTLNVTGNINIKGNSTIINSQNLAVKDSLIILANNNKTDILDIGFYGKYSNSDKFTGLTRVHSDTKKRWTLFKDMIVLPNNTNILDIDIQKPNKVDTLLANYEGYNLNITGNSTITGNLNLGVLNMSGDIVPLNNNSHSLGTPNDRFKELYLSAGTLHIGTEKLSASADGNIIFDNVKISENLNVNNNSTLSNTIIKTGKTFNVVDGISTLGGKLIVNNESNLDNTIIRAGKTFTVIDGDSTLGGKLIVNNESILKNTNITGRLNITGNSTITGNLNLGILNMSGDIVPLSNNSYSLGTSNNRFKDLYLSSSTLFIGSQSISTSSDGIEFSKVNLPKATNSSLGGVKIGSGLLVDGDGVISVGGSGLSKWNTSNNDIYYNTGNVGIGVSNPSVKLDVNGSIKVNENMNISGSTLVNNDIIPLTDNSINIGSINNQYKGIYSKHLYLSQNSLWLGNSASISLNNNKFSINQVNNNVIPLGLWNILPSNLKTGSTRTSIGSAFLSKLTEINSNITSSSSINTITNRDWFNFCVKQSLSIDLGDVASLYPYDPVYNPSDNIAGSSEVEIKINQTETSFATQLNSTQSALALQINQTQTSFAAQLNVTQSSFAAQLNITHATLAMQINNVQSNLSVAVTPRVVSIGSHPVSVNANETSTAIFTATSNVTPMGTKLYLWQRSINLGAFLDLENERSNTLQLTNVALSDTGNRYRCVLDAVNSLYNVTTNHATLSVFRKITINSQPQDMTGYVGVNKTITANVSVSSGSPTYQWQQSTNGTTFTNISSATSNSYLISSPTTSMSGYKYRYVVNLSNSLGPVTSNSVSLTVNPIPTLSITSQPQTPPAIYQPNTSTFSATAAVSDNTTIILQWQKSDDSGVTFTDILNANSTSYTTSASSHATDNGDQYRLKVSHEAATTIFSNAVTWTVNKATITFSTHPQNTAVANGVSVTFTASATVDTGLSISYQWQMGSAGTYSDIQGQTTTSYTFNASSATNNKTFRLKATSAGADDTFSNAATLTVTVPPLSYNSSTTTVNGYTITEPTFYSTNTFQSTDPFNSSQNKTFGNWVPPESSWKSLRKPSDFVGNTTTYGSGTTKSIQHSVSIMVRISAPGWLSNPSTNYNIWQYRDYQNSSNEFMLTTGVYYTFWHYDSSTNGHSMLISTTQYGTHSSGTIFENGEVSYADQFAMNNMSQSSYRSSTSTMRMLVWIPLTPGTYWGFSPSSSSYWIKFIVKNTFEFDYTLEAWTLRNMFPITCDVHATNSSNYIRTIIMVYNIKQTGFGTKLNGQTLYYPDYRTSMLDLKSLDYHSSEWTSRNGFDTSGVGQNMWVYSAPGNTSSGSTWTMDNTYAYWDYSANQSVQAAFSYFVNGLYEDGTTSVSSMPAIGTKFIFGLRVDNIKGSGTYSKSGKQQTWTNNWPATSVTVNGQCHAQGNGLGDMEANLHEIILYSSKLSDSDFESVVKYLNKKWYVYQTGSDDITPSSTGNYSTGGSSTLPVTSNIVSRLDGKANPHPGPNGEPSDDRLKISEHLLFDSIPIILKLRPQIYLKKQSFTSEHYHIESGLIAQEIYYEVPDLRHLVSIPPDASITNIENLNFDDIQNDPDYSNWGSTPATVNYIGLIPYLIKGIQEQQSQINLLKTENSNLQNNFNNLINNIKNSTSFDDLKSKL